MTANSNISHQLRNAYAVRWTVGYVAVKIRKVHYLEIEVFSLVVNAGLYSFRSFSIVNFCV